MRGFSLHVTYHPLERSDGAHKRRTTGAIFACIAIGPFIWPDEGALSQGIAKLLLVVRRTSSRRCCISYQSHICDLVKGQP